MAAYRRDYDSRHLQADWLPSTGIGSGTIRSAIEYGLPFFILFAVPLSEISVDEVFPLYGPASGGTAVGIYGQHLSVSSVTSVYIGHYVLYPDTARLLREFQITLKTNLKTTRK